MISALLCKNIAWVISLEWIEQEQIGMESLVIAGPEH